MAITAAMLAAGATIVLLYKVSAPRVASMPIFNSGMASGLCILGVAWMGSTFIGVHATAVETFSESILTYPSLLAAVEMDDTRTTRVGKYVFNRPFLVPTLATITAAVAVGFQLAALMAA